MYNLTSGYMLNVFIYIRLGTTETSTCNYYAHYSKNINVVLHRSRTVFGQQEPYYVFTRLFIESGTNINSLNNFKDFKNALNQLM